MRPIRLLCLLLLFALGACNLEKDIAITLPAHQPQLVAECYLERGKPYRLTLTESSGFFDEPEQPQVKDATVVIIYRGRREVLRYQPYYDRLERKFYTHSSANIVTGRPGDTYFLEITDGKGRKVTGSTTLLAPIPIDSIQVRFNERKKAFVVARFTDPPSPGNYYFFSVHRDSTNHNAEIDYTSPDDFNNGKSFAFGTNYDFAENDTLFVTLYHLEKAYFHFLNSVEEAREANGNPFAQPARVRSTLQGGFGVFTNLAYDRKFLVVKEKR